MAGTRGASKSNTKTIMSDAAIKARETGSGRWHGRMVAARYERGGALRAMKCDGAFLVRVTRVMDAALPDLFAVATKDAALWFPKGEFEEPPAPRTNIGGGKTAGLEVGFYAKGAGRAPIALQRAGQPGHGGKRTRAVEESHGPASSHCRNKV